MENRNQLYPNDANALLSLIWFVIAVAVLFWFYSAVRRIEKTLKELKAKIDSLSK